MKICIAQTKALKGDIAANIDNHIRFITYASLLKASSIFFPELSLTGYEPELTKDIAITAGDDRLSVFQKLSNKNTITIGVGIPEKTEIGIRISMVIFQPDKPVITYSKQQLHSDELPFFVEGTEQVILTIDDKKVAPAICFESLQPDHSENAINLGAELYLASVAKPQRGLEKALVHFPAVAKKYKVPVLMSNCIGYCDNFMSAGYSSVWTKQGELVGQLDDKKEGIIIFDTENEEAILRIL